MNLENYNFVDFKKEIFATLKSDLKPVIIIQTVVLIAIITSTLLVQVYRLINNNGIAWLAWCFLIFCILIYLIMVQLLSTNNRRYKLASILVNERLLELNKNNNKTNQLGSNFSTNGLDIKEQAKSAFKTLAPIKGKTYSQLDNAEKSMVSDAIYKRLFEGKWALKHKEILYIADLYESNSSDIDSVNSGIDKVLLNSNKAINFKEKDVLESLKENRIVFDD